MQSIFNFLKKKDLYLGITRYLLGLVMISYAVTKIFETQFVLIPFSLWQRPLESISGSGLAWAFLGYSPWFQVLLGFLELIPALLLLFRRTTLIGAILMLPMTLNVFLINHALNLWEGTKTISIVLLVLNCIILLFEWQRIKDLAQIIFGKGRKFNYSIIEISLNTIVVLSVLYFATQFLFDYKNQGNNLTGDWYHHHPVEWNLLSEKIKDSTLKKRNVKIYFGCYSEYSEINDTGYINRNQIICDVNQKNHTLKFLNDKRQLLTNANYRLEGNFLKIDKTIDSSKHIVLTQLYKKRIMQTGAN